MYVYVSEHQGRIHFYPMHIRSRPVKKKVCSTGLRAQYALLVNAPVKTDVDTQLYRSKNNERKRDGDTSSTYATVRVVGLFGVVRRNMTLCKTERA